MAIPNIFYTLDDENNPVPCDDLITWALWLHATDKKKVARTILPNGITVSTVFLGLDHRYPLDPDPRPVLFESMIFGGPDDGAQYRYHTFAEAIEGHRRAENYFISQRHAEIQARPGPEENN